MATLSPERPGSSAVVDDQHPWPGLVSYTEDGAPFFFGREREVAELARLVRQEVLTVLFGKSGLGKSSLLRAGLAPVLRETEFLPIFIRLDYGEHAPTLEAQSKNRIIETLRTENIDGDPPTADETLWEYFHRRGVDWWDGDNHLVKPVLIFDQFEELLTIGQGGHGQTARTTSFLTELEDLVENRVPAGLQKRFEAERGLARQYDLERVAYRVILSLREDFLADLESLHERLRQVISNRFRLLPMSGGQAMDVILKPRANLVSEAVAVEIVHFVSSSERSRLQGPLNRTTIGERQVEPALLSVVLRELNSHRIQSGATTITAELVNGQRATEILEQFFERGLDGLGDRVREFILDELLTSSGARNRVAEEDALSKHGIPPETIATLIDRRILQRQLSGSVKWLELTHDTLADVVRSHRAEQIQRRTVAEAAAREAAVRRELARTHRLVATFAVLLLVAGAGLGFAAYSQFKLRASNRSLEEQQNALAASNSRLLEQQAALAEARDGLAGKNDELRLRAEAEGAAIVNQLRSQVDEWSAGAAPRVLEPLVRVGELSSQFDSPPLKKARAMAGIYGAETLLAYGYVGQGIEAAKGALEAATVLSANAPVQDPAVALVVAAANLAVARAVSEAGRDVEAEGHLRETTRLAELALRGDEATASEARLIQLITRYELGDIDTRRGLFDGPRSRFEALLTALDRTPGIPANRREFLRAESLIQLASLEDEIDRSLPYFTRAMAVVREQSLRNPNDLRWTRLRADLSYRQATAMMDSGRFDDTKRLLQEATSAADSATQADREDRRSAYVRGFVGSGLVQLYQRTGETPRAEAALREAMAISSGLVRQEPSWMSARTLEGILRYHAGDLAGKRLQSLQPSNQAERSREQGIRDREFAASLQIFERIARDAPADAQNRRNVAAIANVMAMDRSASKDYPAAMRLLTQARRSIEQVPASARARPRFQSHLAEVLRLAGFYVHSPSGNRAQAQQSFLEAVTIDKAVAAASPTSAHFVKLGESYRTLGDSYLLDGSVERASDAFAQSLAAYDSGLSRFPNEASLARAKGEMAYYFAGRWRASKRLDAGIASLTVVVDTALEALRSQPLQSDFYELLNKAASETSEIRKLIASGTPQTAGAPLPGTSAVLDALQRRIAAGLDLWPAGITAQEKKALDLTRPLRWPAPSLISGAWRQLSRAEQNAETTRLAAGNAFERRVATDVARIKTLPLNFYEGATLFEVEASRAGAVYNYVRLAGRADYVLEIDGRSQGIHELNRSGSLRLDSADQAAQYVRFFMNALGAQEGNFRIIDGEDDLRFTAEAGTDLRSKIAKFIVPLELHRNQEGKWDARATIRYSNAIFYAVMRVDNLVGEVSMTVDEPVAADLPVFAERFDQSRRALIAPNATDWKKNVAETQQRLNGLLRDTTPLTAERRERITGDYLSLSWYQLHTREFTAALAAAEAGLKVDSSYVPLETNRAHALVFLGRFGEADGIYRQYIGRDTGGKPWEEVIIDDLNTLEKRGLTHPHFARVREIVTIKK